MFKELLLRKLIGSKLKDIPREQQEEIISMVTKNPELFQEIALKIKTKQDSGMDQMKAAMEVMGEYKEQLQSLMGKQ